MSPELWPLVERVFLEALKLPAPERQSFLTLACSDRGEIRQEVESLLASSQTGFGSLDKLLGSVSPSQPPEPAIGSRLGPYRILREIGRGGMGQVYLAHRADQPGATPVAIKLLRGNPEPSLTHRFLHEQRVLAQLEHPNVVRLLATGTADSSSPYFVMEYIDGRSIEGYCDARELCIRERINLFVEVCSAVQFLHRSRVLHRDLKPENVLVNTDGVPKLLDFGVAKHLAPERLEMAAIETGGLAPMTVSFASPEQIRGQTTTTATDIYGLGMLLYRILTGRHPYRPARSLMELLERICREEPERPSRATRRRRSTAPPAPGNGVEASSSKVRGGRAGPGAGPHLDDDLDPIVLKALAKNPLLRHRSAQQLADDLKRYLRGRVGREAAEAGSNSGPSPATSAPNPQPE